MRLVLQAVVTINTSAVAEPTDPRFVSVGVETWEWLFDPDALDNTVLRNVVTIYTGQELPVCSSAVLAVRALADPTALVIGFRGVGLATQMMQSFVLLDGLI